MTTECTLFVDPSCDVLALRRLLFERVLSQPPPFNLQRWLTGYRVPIGRQIRVIVNHANRDVSIVDQDITSHVLRTTVMAFQTHRLSRPAAPRPNVIPRPIAVRLHRATRRAANVDTGQQCSICFESISSHDMATLPCAHSFHEQCIDRWIHRTPSCPLCREPLA